jgi:hypothetical protein
MEPMNYKVMSRVQTILLLLTALVNLYITQHQRKEIDKLRWAMFRALNVAQSCTELQQRTNYQSPSMVSASPNVQGPHMPVTGTIGR